jgi:hypothetical protein
MIIVCMKYERFVNIPKQMFEELTKLTINEFLHTGE